MSRSLGLGRILSAFLSKTHRNRDLEARRCSILLYCSHYNRNKIFNKVNYVYDFSCNRYFHISPLLDTIHTINVPPFAESITEGDIYWKKAVGDRVAVDEIVAEIETDKTNVPVLAPCSGSITELLVEDGTKVLANQALLKLEEGAAPVDSKSTPLTESVSKAAESPKPAVSQSQTSAKSESVKLPSSRSNIQQQQHQTQSLSFASGERSEQRVKMSRIRLRIAERLKEAQNTCAMLSTFNEIDMTNLFELRRQYKDTFLKKHNVKLGMMSTFAKASAVALFDQPAVNAVIDGTDIVYRDYVDISIAVATAKGLVVPVLRNVEKMNYADIELKINELGIKARDGTLAIEDMDGGTFTISNGGVFGSLFGTPIINPPQSAILGLYGVFDRPVARNGQVVIRPMMYVVLTYDHRLIDGREAVLFLRKVKDFVEDPRSYFLQI